MATLEEVEIMQMPLSQIYASVDGTIIIKSVESKIFTSRYYTNCMKCSFCNDICCSYGSDIDVSNVQRILAHADGIKTLLDYPLTLWFQMPYNHDEEFPGSAFTRTSVIDQRCVFLNRRGRGCLLHMYCIEQNLDYHQLKPLVCSLFPITFGGGELMLSTELEDESLICAGVGYTTYQGNREELCYYFGSKFVAELDLIEKMILA